VTTRRAFIGTLAAGLLAAPLTVRAQPAGKVYRIGMLETTSMAMNAVTSRPSDKGCGNSGTSRDATTSSSTVRLTAAASGSRTWLPNWYA